MQNKIIVMNVGEGQHRNWDDCRSHGFLSAGNGVRWRNQILKVEAGNIVIAYLNGYPKNGFVGVGEAIAGAVRVLDFTKSDGSRLRANELEQPGLFKNAQSSELSEYLVAVNWMSALPREQARWRRKSGLATTRHLLFPLVGKQTTLEFIESVFELKLN